MGLSRVLVIFLLSTLAAAQEHQHVVLYGSPALRSQTVSRASPAAATAALCAASGLVPPFVVDKTTATAVTELVQAQSVLEAGPKALVLLHLAGISPGSSSTQQLHAAVGQGAVVQLDLDASPGSLLQSSSDIVTANPQVEVTVLDHSGLQDCPAGICLQQHLHKALHHCGGKLHSQQDIGHTAAKRQGLQGQLQLPGLEEHLDTELPGVKLYALELASLQGSTEQLLGKLNQQASDSEEVLPVYESTFVGLQALAAHFSRDSPQIKAAEDALMQMLARFITDLKGVYGDEVLVQVAFLGDAPVSSSDPLHLLDWKEVSRRALLQHSDPTLHLGQDDPSSSKSYAEKATAYAVTLLLIWFTFAGVHCMLYMPFKQDTLLYGRSKAD